MKKVLFAIIIILASQRVFSLDLELIGGLGNLAFDKERTGALSEESVKGAFTPNLYPLVLTQFSGDFRGFKYHAGFERDPITRNRLFANLRADLDYFYVEAGPYIGLFNSRKLPLDPGISAALGMTIPGIVFVQVQGASTLAAPLELTDYYYQNDGDIAVGFWVPYVVCSLNMSVKNFTSREQANLLIKDSCDRYFFRADVYTKNVPYTIQVDLGFQNLSRSYIKEEVSGSDIVKNTQTDEFKSVFMGFEVTYTASQSLKILLGGEMPVYSWGSRPMKDPSKGTFLFKARAGLVWTLPEKNTL